MLAALRLAFTFRAFSCRWSRIGTYLCGLLNGDTVVVGLFGLCVARSLSFDVWASPLDEIEMVKSLLFVGAIGFLYLHSCVGGSISLC